MNTWTQQSHLPDDEPNAHNANDYAVPQLCAGISSDGQWIYDAIYQANAGCFVLTLLQLNTEWGFIEHERRYLASSRHDLLTQIAQIEQNPSQWLTQPNNITL